MKTITAALLVVTEALGEKALQAGSPLAVLWSGPAIVIASLMIAWGAEATQFFIAQGIALAVLALLQTLPEFAVEAVLAWHQEVSYLFANLTGALKLLTGLGWPMIYFAAASSYRKAHGSPMRRIHLDSEQAIQILGLLVGIAYQFVIWWKGSLNLFDGLVLLTIYVAYLWVMRRIPPQQCESIDEVGGVPRLIVRAPKAIRIASILGLFLVGGAAVFLVADPFLKGLYGLSTTLGISYFMFISWVAPIVSEAPEGISAFYWARNYDRASIALMNLVSSNINQWTLLAALLPVVLSVSTRHFTAIPLDSQQSLELIMTLAQSLLGALFLINMELAWWEAAGLFVLFVTSLGATGSLSHWIITGVYFAWCAVELVRLLAGNRKAIALRHLRELLAPARRLDSAGENR
jgi:cation:H+ antiporter